MGPRICAFDIGCEPSPSVPAETLLQDGRKTYLLFFAVSKVVEESGYFEDLGVAVLDCKRCATAKFGYPNDEGLPEHPLSLRYHSITHHSRSTSIEPRPNLRLRNVLCDY
jgi:hypothetical protein